MVSSNLSFLTLLSLLLLSVSFISVTSSSFLQCMTISQQLHSPNTSSYSSLLHSYHQNLKNIPSFTVPKPFIIVTPLYEFEIQAALLCSKKHGLKIRIRSGGHDYEGLSTTSNVPFIIIDLVNFRSITVDMDDETAWVQAGATLGEVYYAIAKESNTHGFPAGICPSVGVGGHISGGGLGTMLRKYGLASDNVVDAYLMDVNGKILNRKSMGEDLFWAIRGGGGASFGIILSWKIKLVHVPPKVTVFNIKKILDQGVTKLVQRWQNIAHKLDENLFIRVIVEIVHGEKGEKKIQVSFNSLFLGGIQELLPLMKRSFPELGLVATACTEMSWIKSTLYFFGYQNEEHINVLLNRTHSDTSFFKAKSDFVRKPLSENAFEEIWKRILDEEVAFMIMDPYGGKMTKISEYETSFAHRKGYLYNIQYLVKWEKGGAAKKHIEWLRKLYKHMSAHVSNSPRVAYVNYRDLDLGKDVIEGNVSYTKSKVWGEKYFNRNFIKLAMVKGMVDPDNFFRNEQSIPPLVA
ncbi:hypothetical protein AQUCO_02000180v1 [Aquilegia coerulea]|uniref:FAD-binding PCMH-type domain-containing protein n=1 Tax=Aquilegia coerulea TaxID=218851 RepID=A0A2G5DG97_AQUCA|nr:hypothetical protein AQUCO_02000180v1 [Aquilegia coerulea]